jgi:hypothetical protein
MYEKDQSILLLDCLEYQKLQDGIGFTGTPAALAYNNLLCCGLVFEK